VGNIQNELKDFL